MKVITGFRLEGYCITMFGRAGSGIYTKTADISAIFLEKMSAVSPKMIRETLILCLTTLEIILDMLTVLDLTLLHFICISYLLVTCS